MLLVTNVSDERTDHMAELLNIWFVVNYRIQVLTRATLKPVMLFTKW